MTLCRIFTCALCSRILAGCLPSHRDCNPVVEEIASCAICAHSKETKPR